MGQEAIGSSNAVLRFELVSVRSFRVIRNAGANGELARYLVSQICSHLRVAENDAISLDRYQEACSIARKCVEPRKNVIELIPYSKYQSLSKAERGIDRLRDMSDT